MPAGRGDRSQRGEFDPLRAPPARSSARPSFSVLGDAPTRPTSGGSRSRGAVCHRTRSTRELAPKTPHSVAHGASPIMPVPIPLLDIPAQFLRSVGPLKCP